MPDDAAHAHQPPTAERVMLITGASSGIGRAAAARFGRDGWACESLSPEDGETPVDRIFVKERCRKDIDAKTTAVLTTRHLRKAGQSQFDPRTGRETAGQFESSVRFELVQK